MANEPAESETPQSSESPADRSSRTATDESASSQSGDPDDPPSTSAGGERNEGTWLGFRERAKPLVQAGIVLGLGLGGFFDGIVIHQILQLHHMVSARAPPTDLAGMEVNVLADGLFHAGTYLFTIAGIVLLYRAWRRPTVPVTGRALLGAALMGFGIFNLVEGIVDHHLLELHHVWPAGPRPTILWDLLFLLSGVLLLTSGYAIARSDSDATPAPTR